MKTIKTLFLVIVLLSNIISYSQSAYSYHQEYPWNVNTPTALKVNETYDLSMFLDGDIQMVKFYYDSDIAGIGKLLIPLSGINTFTLSDYPVITAKIEQANYHLSNNPSERIYTMFVGKATVPSTGISYSSYQEWDILYNGAYKHTEFPTEICSTESLTVIDYINYTGEVSGVEITPLYGAVENEQGSFENSISFEGLNGNYTLDITITNQHGIDKTISTTILVKPALTLTIPLDDGYCSGEEITLVPNVPNGNLYFNSDLQNTTTITLSTNAIDTIKYEYANSNGCVSTFQQEVMTSTPSPITITNGDGITPMTGATDYYIFDICDGADINLIPVGDMYQAKYNWYTVNNLLLETDAEQFTLSNVTEDIVVKVKAEVGTCVSNTLTIQVRKRSNPNVTFYNSDPVACEGETVQLKVVSDYLDQHNPHSDIGYQWSENSIDISTSNTINVMAEMDKIYKLEKTYEYTFNNYLLECTNSDTISNHIDNINLELNSSFCQGLGYIDLNQPIGVMYDFGNVGLNQYLDEPGQINTDVNSAYLDTPYPLTMLYTSMNGCNFTQTQDVIFKSSYPAPLVDTAFTNAKSNVFYNMNGYVVGTCAKDTVNLHIPVPQVGVEYKWYLTDYPTEILSSTSELNYTLEHSYPYYYNSNADEYLNITVEATNTNGCTRTSEILYLPREKPEIDYTVLKDSFCLGESHKIISNVGEVGNVIASRIDWKNESGENIHSKYFPQTYPEPGYSSLADTLIQASPYSTSYYLTISSIRNSTSPHARWECTSDPLEINVAIDSNIVNYNITDHLCFNQGNNIELEGANPSGGNYTNEELTITNNTLITPLVGKYKIDYTYENANGCITIASDTLRIKQNPAPIILSDSREVGNAQEIYGCTEISANVENYISTNSYIFKNTATDTLASFSKSLLLSSATNTSDSLLLENANYYAFTKDQYCTSDTINIKPFTLPSPVNTSIIPAKELACIGESVDLNTNELGNYNYTAETGNMLVSEFATWSENENMNEAVTTPVYLLENYISEKPIYLVKSKSTIIDGLSVGSCASDIIDYTLPIDLNIVQFKFNDELCLNSLTNYELVAATPTGGNYTSEDITIVNNSIEAPIAGNHIITYTLENANGCITIKKDTLHIHTNPGLVIIEDANVVGNYNELYGCGNIEASVSNYSSENNYYFYNTSTNELISNTSTAFFDTEINISDNSLLESGTYFVYAEDEYCKSEKTQIKTFALPSAQVPEYVSEKEVACLGETIDITSNNVFDSEYNSASGSVDVSQKTTWSEDEFFTNSTTDPIYTLLDYDIEKRVYLFNTKTTHIKGSLSGVCLSDTIDFILPIELEKELIVTRDTFCSYDTLTHIIKNTSEFANSYWIVENDTTFNDTLLSFPIPSEILAKGVSENSCHYQMEFTPSIDYINPDFISEEDLQNIEIGDIIHFHYTGSDVVSYEWDFGEGLISRREDPYHYFNTDGDFDVTLTVESVFGCKDTITKEAFAIVTTLEELAEENITIYPNPFTDYIKIDSGKEINYRIINTEGKEILKGKDKIINTQSLATGQYIILLEFDNSIKTLKIIKNN